MIDSRAKYVLPIMRHHSGPLGPIAHGRVRRERGALSQPFSIATAGADAYWTNAIEMPDSRH